MMKQLAAGLFAAILLLSAVGCTQTPEPPETLQPSEAETAAADLKGRENREILGDWKQITPSGEHDARILFISSGKSDSILVSVDGVNVLIDAGTASSPAKIVPALDWMGVEQLDAVFLTHTDNDHVGGYAVLADMYPIETVYTPAISAEWSKFETIIGGAAWEALEPGAAVPLTEGVWLEVLAPSVYHPLADDNNSLVLKLDVNGVRTLFAGDMMYDEEKTLLRTEFDLDCDILKVGHHGKKDATSVSFLNAVTPDYAVICTDRAEESDTAHKSVVKELEKRCKELVITDDYELGVLFTIEKNGKIRVEEAEPADCGQDISFVSVSKAEQTVVLANTGKTDADLSRWAIVSKTGSELFFFPDGAVLPAGGELSVACRTFNPNADYYWEETRVWNKTKEDRALLIDRWGNVIDEADSQ